MIEINKDKIIKWAVISIVLYILFLMFSSLVKGRSKCETICLEKGFPSFSYAPTSHGRYSTTRESCSCISEEESKVKNRLPKGTRVF